MVSYSASSTIERPERQRIWPGERPGWLEVLSRLPCFRRQIGHTTPNADLRHSARRVGAEVRNPPHSAVRNVRWGLACRLERRTTARRQEQTLRPVRKRPSPGSSSRRRPQPAHELERTIIPRRSDQSPTSLLAGPDACAAALQLGRELGDQARQSIDIQAAPDRFARRLGLAIGTLSRDQRDQLQIAGTAGVIVGGIDLHHPVLRPAAPR